MSEHRPTFEVVPAETLETEDGPQRVQLVYTRVAEERLDDEALYRHHAMNFAVQSRGVRLAANDEADLADALIASAQKIEKYLRGEAQ